jgi:hypothetical protein
VFICVKSYSTHAKLWVDEVYETTAAEVKRSDPKIMCEIIGIYEDPNEDMWMFEKLADWTEYMGSTMKRSIIRGDLNLRYADWNGHAEKSRGT